MLAARRLEYPLFMSLEACLDSGYLCDTNDRRCEVTVWLHKKVDSMFQVAAQDTRPVTMLELTQAIMVFNRLCAIPLAMYIPINMV
jgi:hypothetical protein